MKCGECVVADDCKTVWREERLTPAANCRIARLLAACHRQRDRARGAEGRVRYVAECNEVLGNECDDQYEMLLELQARSEQAEWERDEARAKLRELAQGCAAITNIGPEGVVVTTEREHGESEPHTCYNCGSNTPLCSDILGEMQPDEVWCTKWTPRAGGEGE